MESVEVAEGGEHKNNSAKCVTKNYQKFLDVDEIQMI